MAKSHFINRSMAHIDQSTVVDEMPKANQVWLDEFGVQYTILSVRNKAITKHFPEPGGKSRAAKVHSTWVTAYTHDLSVEHPNGSIDGEPVHFVDELKADKFVEQFTRWS